MPQKKYIFLHRSTENSRKSSVDLNLHSYCQFFIIIFFSIPNFFSGFPWWLSDKESSRQYRRLGFDP